MSTVSTPPPAPTPAPAGSDDSALRGFSWWMLLVGATLLLLGFMALSLPWVAAPAVLQIAGILLLVSGLVHVFKTFMARRLRSYLLHALGGVVDLILGLLLVFSPVEMGTLLVLLAGWFFLIAGVYRIIMSLVVRIRHWPWVLLSGVIGALLGLAILANWPEKALLVIAYYIGIDLIFRGLGWVMMGLAARHAATHVAPPTGPLGV